MKEDIRELRSILGISQMALAIAACIPRSRLSASELRLVSLTNEEHAAALAVLAKIAEQRATRATAVARALSANEVVKIRACEVAE